MNIYSFSANFESPRAFGKLICGKGKPKPQPQPEPTDSTGTKPTTSFRPPHCGTC